jgi:hypothetical protein
MTAKRAVPNTPRLPCPLPACPGPPAPEGAPEPASGSAKGFSRTFCPPRALFRICPGECRRRTPIQPHSRLPDSLSGFCPRCGLALAGAACANAAPCGESKIMAPCSGGPAFRRSQSLTLPVPPKKRREPFFGNGTGAAERARVSRRTRPRRSGRLSPGAGSRRLWKG